MNDACGALLRALARRAIKPAPNGFCLERNGGLQICQAARCHRTRTEETLSGRLHGFALRWRKATPYQRPPPRNWPPRRLATTQSP